MEILVPTETLSNKRRPNHLAIRSDQLSVGLARKHELPNRGDHGRVKNAQYHRRQYCKTKSNLQFIAQHRDSNQDRPSPVKTRSINLIPMNGTMTPPTP